MILDAGYNKFFSKPSGFLEVEGFKIVERVVKQLKNNGVEKIVIVTGDVKIITIKNLLKNKMRFIA